MKQRGKRIRPSGKDLVFHFTIASPACFPAGCRTVSCEDNPADQLRILTYHKQIRLTFPI